MRILLRRNAPRPAGVPPWLYAWTSIRTDSPTLICLAPRQPPGVKRRVQHELEHARDLGFTNETHHPWFHFCVRCVSPLRFGHHAKVSTLAEANELLGEGELDG